MNREQVLPSGNVLRYTLDERITHWIAAGSYIYLLLTGLAFWSPWLFWLAVILGGGQISRMLHPWVGLIFFLSVVYMYRLWASQMGMTADDKAWVDSVGHYIRNEDSRMPPAGRYNAGQKFLFWGFFWCAIVLLLTGVVLWVPEWIPWSLRSLRYIAVIIHPIAALLTIALFLIHIYMGVFAERGAFSAMTRGYVSAAFARRFHPGWYEEIISDAPSRRK